MMKIISEDAWFVSKEYSYSGGAGKIFFLFYNFPLYLLNYLTSERDEGHILI